MPAQKAKAVASLYVLLIAAMILLCVACDWKLG